MKTNKKAISLIVLVITIIVLAILATTVIITLSNTNIMEQASNAAFRSDMANYKQAASLYVTSQMAENKTGDYSIVDMSASDFNTYFDVPEKYDGKLSIVDGKLAYETTDDTEKSVLQEMGITIITPLGDEEPEDEPVVLAAGLYEGDTLVTPWDDLIEDGIIIESNGRMVTQANVDEGTNASSEALVGKLVLPDTITTIGEYAFFFCFNLTEIVFPETLTTFESYALCCSGFPTVNIPGSVKIIPNGFLGGGSADTVIFSEGVESIETGAFEDLGIHDVNIYIPSTITYLGKCETALEGQVFHYNGTQDSWEDIEKDEWWDAPSYGYKVVFSNGNSIEVEACEGPEGDWLC